MAKFCGNCGAQMEDSAKVCGYCGTPFENAVVAPSTGVVVAGGVSKQGSGKLSKIVILLVIIVAVVVGIFSFSSISNEPCDWCSKSPTKVFKTQSGEKSYVCSECRRECAWCDKKATKHYENLFEMVVFVCNDCYKDITE